MSYYSTTANDFWNVINTLANFITMEKNLPYLVQRLILLEINTDSKPVFCRKSRTLTVSSFCQFHISHVVFLCVCLCFIETF